MSDKENNAEGAELRSIGLDGTIVRNLVNNGIINLRALSAMSVDDLVDIGVEAEDAYEILKKVWTKLGLFTPADKLEERQVEFLTTGSEVLNKLLGGGVATGEITEFVGAYGSGKTQTLLTITAETLGRNSSLSAIFMDSEQTFKTSRLWEIARLRGYDENSVVNRTLVVRAPTTDQFIYALKEAPIYVKDNNVKLICLDSLAGPFRSEYLGRESLWERQQRINRVLRKLLQYALSWNLAVVLTNQVVANPQQMYSPDIIDVEKPALGNIVAHGCATRVYIQKARENKRIMRLFDSSWLPEGECVVRITQKGIEDA